MPTRSATRSGRDASHLLLALVLIALLPPALAASAESETDSTPAESETLRVGAASSLREVLDDFRPIFAEKHPDVRVEIGFGASSTLAAQLRAGAPLDLFLSADERTAIDLEREGLTEPPAAFAGNRLVVMASRDLGAEITSARDLLRPEVRRVAIPAPAVPVGHYARSWLRAQGVLDALEPRAVRTEHARATLVAVDQGSADAAIVYHSDARHAKSARVAFEIPALEQPRIAYVGAVVKGAPAERLARAFLQSLRELRSSALFIRDGFSLAPQPAP